MFDHYILDDQRRPVRVSVLEWAKWFENAAARHVGDEMIAGYRVNTVFIGLPSAFGGPWQWETMVFGDDHLNMDMERCGGTWEQAEEMHRRMVQRVREALGIPEPKEELSGD